MSLNELPSTSGTQRKPYEERRIQKLLKEGKDIRDNYCPSDNINPVMIPPAPNLSPYIDKYQEGLELSNSNKSNQQRQQDYEAEVKVYRALERLKENVVVLHSLKYTHGDYKLFVGDHLLSSGKKKGKKCSLKDKDPEGECDFVVLGPDYFVVIEVKNVAIDNNVADEERSRQCQALTGTFHKSVEQRIKTTNLIRGILGASATAVKILHFSAYPNLSAIYKTEFQIEEDLLSTVIFKDDLETLNDFWKTFVDTKQSSRQNSSLQSFLSPVHSFLASVQPILSSEQSILFSLQSILFFVESFSLVFGWNTGHQDTSVDEQDRLVVDPEILNHGKDTLLALWCTEKNKCNKMKCSLGWNIADIYRQLRVGEITFRSKKRDLNPGVEAAPAIVKNFVGVNNLTTEQNRVLNSDQRLLWVNGPAGSGKTVILSAKIIGMVQSNKDDKVVLIKFGGEDNNSTHYQDALKRANVTFNLTETYIAKHQPSELVNQISQSDSQVFIVKVTGASDLTWLTDTIGLLHQYHVFVDDVHSKLWVNPVRQYGEFIETLRRLSATKTVWLACDLIQGYDAMKLGVMKQFAALLAQSLSSVQLVSLSMNLRNTCDLSDLLSKIRDQYIKSGSERPDVFDVLLPTQSPGHFIHGPKTVFHVLNHCGVTTLSHLVNVEIKKLLTKDTIKENEIAILYPTLKNAFKSAIKDVLSNFSDNPGTEIAFCTSTHSNSAEWPAVIVLHNMISDNEMQLSLLYQAISRARVYCSVILYPSVGETKQDIKISFIKGDPIDLNSVISVSSFGFADVASSEVKRVPHNQPTNQHTRSMIGLLDKLSDLAHLVWY